MNGTIINEFEKLIYQTQQIIECKLLFQNNDKFKNIFNEIDKLEYKLNAYKKALNIIKSYQYRILSGSEIEPIAGIGKGIVKRIDIILENGILEEYSTDFLQLIETLKAENIKNTNSIDENIIDVDIKNTETPIPTPIPTEYDIKNTEQFINFRLFSCFGGQNILKELNETFCDICNNFNESVKMSLGNKDIIQTIPKD
jgi:DNA polymerase/3'-5' exonuclease PolX